MSIRWDSRNKRWRFEFDRMVQGERKRASKLLPKGWTRAQADAYDRQESGHLYAEAVGIEKRDPPIGEAVILYLRDKRELKSYAQAEEHLKAIRWAYEHRLMSELPEVSREIIEKNAGAAATARNRLALLKAAARWAWKAHGLTDTDPTTRMQMPTVRNERHVYIGRRDMLRAARACTNHKCRIAIRVAFYTGMRLGELQRARGIELGGKLVFLLEDTKNGNPRVLPVHPRIKHLVRFFPLEGPKVTIQRAWDRARTKVGLGEVHFHDLRHSTASELVNNGVPLNVIGKVLGHKDERSTRRYAHLQTATLEAAIANIGAKK